ncbi:Cytochrome P450 78A9 [Nymphaea thermarum]|nr:Cytochrome P450 78A9 [Nymphaea thermarum]
MDSWIIFFLALFTISVSLILVGLPHRIGKKKKKKIPPGPKGLPVIGNLHQLGLRFIELEPILRKLRAQYGPVFSVRFGPRTAIFVAAHDLAHQALVQSGATFAGRLRAAAFARIFNSNQHTISSASYGPLWRLFRRNLMAEVLSPARTKSFAEGREWVLSILLGTLRTEADANGGVVVPVRNFRHAMFCLLLCMCFGEKVEDDVVQKVETALRTELLAFERFNILGIFPILGKIFFRQRWRDLLEIRRKQEEALLPLIRARRSVDEKNRFCYVDSLLSLELPDGRKLDEGEVVTLCNEFLNGGTDTTSTAVQWVLANLVKNPQIQAKLHEEIRTVAGEDGEVSEESVSRMPYLKAVIMEALRKHPPGHFVLPHTVTEEEVSLNGYSVPKDATINFMVGEMGLDGKVWKHPLSSLAHAGPAQRRPGPIPTPNPLEFRPERFLPEGEGEDVDITGTRGIKMMPFGAGRRICPGMGLALLHLQYFVANMVREFEWSVPDGEPVDLTEKVEFTVVMKNPLRAKIESRKR